MTNESLQHDVPIPTGRRERLRRIVAGDTWIGTLLTAKDSPDEHVRVAYRSFRRLLICTFASGAVMVVAALGYLSTNGPLNAMTAIATTLGVFFSVTLGAGLMALGFLSANSGHDDRAAAHVHHEPSA